MTIKNFDKANYQACYIEQVAAGIPYLGKGIDDEQLKDAVHSLELIIEDARETLKFIEKTQNRRRKARNERLER